MSDGDGDAPIMSGDALETRAVGLLLLISAISVFVLWSLNPFAAHGQHIFALYLAIDFVAFAMMSYVYRTINSQLRISRALMLAGCIFIAALIIVSLFGSFLLPN